MIDRVAMEIEKLMRSHKAGSVEKARELARELVKVEQRLHIFVDCEYDIYELAGMQRK